MTLTIENNDTLKGDEEDLTPEINDDSEKCCDEENEEDKEVENNKENENENLSKNQNTLKSEGKNATALSPVIVYQFISALVNRIINVNNLEFYTIYLSLVIYFKMIK